MKENSFSCPGCGASVEFEPGTDNLKCPYCDKEVDVEAGDGKVEELDFHEHLSLDEGADDVEMEDRLTVDCGSCGAQVTFDSNITSSDCPYCGTPIVAQEKSTKALKPKSLLPFKVKTEQAVASFRDWVKKRWFAPSNLKKYARLGKISGIYIPYWTYDCRTFTEYTGMRGKYYWTTETYTTTVNGKTQRKTRRVRKIRWYPASGSVANGFDDILVLASTSLPASMPKNWNPGTWKISPPIPGDIFPDSVWRVMPLTWKMDSQMPKAR